MTDVLMYWWPSLLGVALCGLLFPVGLENRRRIKAHTDICPTCGGEGRVTKRSQS